MARKWFLFAAIVAVAGLALGGCSGGGSEPMAPDPMAPDPMDMPMQAAAADSLGR